LKDYHLTQKKFESLKFDIAICDLENWESQYEDLCQLLSQEKKALRSQIATLKNGYSVERIILLFKEV